MDSLYYKYFSYTKNCIIYLDTEVGLSKFYLHRKYVPLPIPAGIMVDVGSEEDGFEIEYIDRPISVNNPIVRTVFYVEDHQKVVRFAAKAYAGMNMGYSKEPPFHSIYIPYYVFEDLNEEKRLQITVRWR